jgi:integrase/recombinase XerD
MSYLSFEIAIKFHPFRLRMTGGTRRHRQMHFFQCAEEEALRCQQIANGMIAYERHKTGQLITIKLEPCMQDIIDRYTSGHETDGYVFPILTTTNPSQAYHQYQSRLRAYNRALHQLERKARLHGVLTSYVVRHTWASLAYDTNIDLAVISSALGHSNTNTTRVYIQGINNQRLADANQKVLNRIITAYLASK